MILSVYLHKDKVDVLKMFDSDLSQAINKMLDAADQGYFDVEDKPECESRDGASRYNVNVTNESYLQLLQTFGVKSKRVSLRRLIYWFVDNEIYNELGWEVCDGHNNADKDKYNKKVDKIIGETEKLLFSSTNYETEIVQEILNLLYNLRR